MFETLRAYRANDPAAQNLLEVALLYPGVKAIALHRLAHPLFKAGIPFLPRLISELARWLTGIEIHPGATIGRRLVIDHGMGIVIGETARVGDDCLFYHGVTLGSHGGKGCGCEAGKPRHPQVGSRVMIGAGAKIIGALNIGDDVQIGANAVVTHDLPNGVTAVGIPARVRGKQ